MLDAYSTQLAIFRPQGWEVARIRFDAGNPRKRKPSPLAPTDDAVDELSRSATWVKDGVIRLE